MEKHNERYRDTPHTSNSLRRKFASLANQMCPTEGHEMPIEVKSAKESRLKIFKHGDVSNAMMELAILSFTIQWLSVGEEKR